MKLIEVIKGFIKENEELVKKVPIIWIGEILERYSSENGDELFDPPLIDINFAEKEIGKAFARDHHIEYRSKYTDLDVFTVEEPADWSKIKIRIHRNFVFDVRLIPNQYKSIEVLDFTYGNDPHEFSYESDSPILLAEVYSPDNYERFVDNNFDSITERLGLGNTTKSKILDALTGNFEEYKKHCAREIKDFEMKRQKKSH